MKILAIASDVPCRTHGQPGVTAVNIVLYELLKGLAGFGQEIALQVIFNQYTSGPDPSQSEHDELSDLAGLGVMVLPPIYPSEYGPMVRSSALKSRLISLSRWCLDGDVLNEVYPAVVLREKLRERIRATQTDAVLTIWSPEGIAATHGIRETPRIAYHGDVDFGPAEARLRDRALFADVSERAREGRSLLDSVRTRLWLSRFKRSHFSLMRDVDVIANVTASNAEFYTAQGHPCSVYIGNVWSDANVELGDDVNVAMPVGVTGRPIKIIGHVGKLRQTGSTYGLRFLLLDVLPELDRAMEGLDYQVHIIGGGEVVPTLKPALEHPRIVVRGFVQDLDSELRSSHAFLLLNNVGSYQAAYTRHMVAWAQELCLVVHENSGRAIPEIRHMENALVGGTAVEVARMIHLATTNSEVNLRVRKGGRATYERHFTPAVIARALTDEIERALGARAERPRL